MSIEDFWFRDILQLCQAPRLAIGEKWGEIHIQSQHFWDGNCTPADAGIYDCLYHHFHTYNLYYKGQNRKISSVQTTQF